MIATLADEFEVEPEVLAADVAAFVDDLSASGVIVKTERQ